MNKYLIEYHRISDPTQLAGTGLAQQKAPTELIDELTKEHNLTVYPKIFDDRGISAFKRTKIRHGYEELKALLDSGDVHPDSVLVVLNQDRLNRTDVFDAQVELMTIMQKCRIYIIHDNRLLDRNSPQIMEQLILSLANAQRAHSESVAKSERTKGAVLKKINDHHNGKRGANGKPLNLGMGKLPWWYSIAPSTKEIEPITDAVKAAQEAVNLFIKGESVYGVKRYLDEHHQLPEKLSKKAKNGWSIDVVRRLHKSANLIGEFAISINGIKLEVTDYIEPILDRPTYLKFLKVRSSKSTPRRAKDGAVAVFGGLGHCRSCGGTLTSLSDRGKSSLRCTNSLNRRVKCESPVSLSGDWFKEYMVESVLRNLGTKKTIKEIDYSRVPLLQEKLSDAQKKLVELGELLLSNPSQTIATLVTNQEKLIDELQVQLMDTEIREVTEVFEPMEQMPTDDVELKAAFKRLIKDMRVYKISRGTNLVSFYTNNDVNVNVVFNKGVVVKEGYLSGTSDGDEKFIDDEKFYSYVNQGNLDHWLAN